MNFDLPEGTDLENELESGLTVCANSRTSVLHNLPREMIPEVLVEDRECYRKM